MKTYHSDYENEGAEELTLTALEASVSPTCIKSQVFGNRKRGEERGRRGSEWEPPARAGASDSGQAGHSHRVPGGPDTPGSLHEPSGSGGDGEGAMTLPSTQLGAPGHLHTPHSPQLAPCSSPSSSCAQAAGCAAR